MKRFAVALLLVIGLPLSAAEWQVAPGASIAAAVQAAKPGDTVRVARGYYAEHLVIDKPLRLIGIDRPTLAGGDQGDVIRVDTATRSYIERANR